MIENDEKIGTNYEQSIAMSIPATRDYVDLIDNQSKSIEPEIDKEDYFTRFLSDIANIKDLSRLEDNSIYIDQTIDDVTRQCLYFFQDEIDSVFESDLGIRFNEPNLFLLKAIYNVFVYKFPEYFIYFINGIQKMDESFKEDIPDYESYKFSYFITKFDKKEENKYQNISEYIQYILSLNFSFNDFLSICLLESSGNVDLSAIYIEDANYRISCDESFLFNKLKNIILSSSIYDYVIINLIDQI